MPAQFQKRAQSTVRILWGLLAASILIPALLLGLAIWQSRAVAIRDARAASERSALALLSQVQNIFQTYELAMDRVEDLVRASDDDEALRTSRSAHDRLVEITRKYDQIGSVWVLDPTSKPLVSSLFYPAPVRDKYEVDFMRAFQSGERGTQVSPPVVGSITGRRLFNVARPIVNADGSLRAVIAIAAYPEYFNQRFQRTGRDLDWSASLVHADGAFLARSSDVPTLSGGARATEAFMQARAQSPDGAFQAVSGADGVRREVFYRKVGVYPVYVLYGVGTQAVLATWWQRAVLFGLFAVAAMLGLTSMIWLALSRSRGAQRAAAELVLETNKRKEMEAKLVTAQRMEALGQLTGGIAHDFNNLLTIVMGNLDLLRRAPEERRARLIDNGLHAVEQGRRLTQQLLAFGRRQPLRPEVVDVNALIAGMGDMLAQSLRGDISVELDLGQNLWPVEADSVQLQTTLINLAVNARDAMPKGGRFAIRTSNSAAGSGQGVLIVLSDTGQGMEPAVLERAIEPFFTTKDIGRGTGLGLSQVVGFIEQSGGSVEIASEVGRGTSVTLLLPRAHVEPVCEPTPEEAAIPPQAMRKARLLLVEDNAPLRELAQVILTEAGHEVTEAASADQALKILQQTPGLEFVLSDLVMPGELDGLDLARIVRDQYPGVAILLATGYSEEAAKVHAEGFTLIAKPYHPESLNRAIQEQLARNEPLAENVIALRK